MSRINTFIPSGFVVLGLEAAHRLVNLGDGDAAILYLHMLDHQGADELKWDAKRLNSAGHKLIKAGLANPKNSASPAPQEGAAPAPATRSNGRDITGEQDNNVSFAELTEGLKNREAAKAIQLIEDCVGKHLSTMDLQIAYQIFDGFSQQLDLLSMMLEWTKTVSEKKKGVGRPPIFKDIRAEWSKWTRKGILSIEAAQSYIDGETILYDREESVMRTLGIPKRALSDEERETIKHWCEMGFSDQVIRFAYDKTVNSLHKANWKYMTTIMESWHSKGLHTMEEVQNEHAQRPAFGGTPGGTPAGFQQQRSDAYAQRAREDMDYMRRMMEQMKEEEAAEAAANGGGEIS